MEFCGILWRNVEYCGVLWNTVEYIMSVNRFLFRSQLQFKTDRTYILCAGT